MKQLNATVLQASDTTSQTSVKIDSNQLLGASFHVFFGDITVGGSVKIQASNDLAPTNYTAIFVTPPPSNWVDVPGASATITAGAPVLITIPNTSLLFRWMRVVFTETTPGTSTVTCNMFAVSV